MADVSTWERLPDVVRLVMAGAGVSEQQAREKICQALSGGELGFRARLRWHPTKRMRSKSVLDSADFEPLPTLRPDDLDWEQSRPLKPWTVKHGAFKLPGRWELAWIEISKSDVTRVLCQPQAPASTNQPTPRPKQARVKSRPTLERAQRVVRELYPNGLPDQSSLPNTMLCSQVSRKLKELKQLSVSDDTILRAAGRRK